MLTKGVLLDEYSFTWNLSISKKGKEEEKETLKEFYLLNKILSPSIHKFEIEI